jgi:hypothetical protein
MTAAASGPKPTSEPAREAGTLIVHQHSDLLYWWVVWGYGFLCALLTRVQGKEISLEGTRSVLMYPGAWLGISFVMLVLFVLTFTTLRARGVISLLLFLILLTTGLIVQFYFGWDQLLSFAPLLLVHMNLAFYLLFSGTLLVVWLFAIFVRDRLTRYEFARGSISKRVALSEGSESFTSPQIEIARDSDDVFVHRLLGLAFLGFGTGDIRVRFSTPGDGQHVYLLKNVWRSGRVEREINRLLA